MKGPLQQEKDWDKSLFSQPSREPTELEQRLILSLCLEEGLLAAMENHLYLFNKEVRRQEDGLGIGGDVSRAAARLVMLDWDRLYQELLSKNNLTSHMYERYVDDTAQGMEALPEGMRWSLEESRFIMRPELVEEDRRRPADQRTMEEVGVKMGNSISAMI